MLADTQMELTKVLFSSFWHPSSTCSSFPYDIAKGLKGLRGVFVMV